MPNATSPIKNSYWVITERFMAGKYPGWRDTEKTRQQLDRFLEAGFNSFVDLTANGELVPYDAILREQAQVYQMDAQYQRFSIGNFGVPTRKNMRAILDAISQALANGRKIYLHCWAGIGRTGTTVGCYLVENGMTGEEALQQVGAWCRYAASPESAQQKQFIRNWR